MDGGKRGKCLPTIPCQSNMTINERKMFISHWNFWFTTEWLWKFNWNWIGWLNWSFNQRVFISIFIQSYQVTFLQTDIIEARPQYSTQSRPRPASNRRENGRDSHWNSFWCSPVRWWGAIHQKWIKIKTNQNTISCAADNWREQYRVSHHSGFCLEYFQTREAKPQMKGITSSDWKLSFLRQSRNNHF